MNRRFVLVTSGMMGGVWGSGATICEAYGVLKKVNGGKHPKNWKTYMFTSELPFAPYEREAAENESDVYLNREGYVCYTRCEMTELG